MFCKFCGKEISDTAKFCSSCGGKVSETGAVTDFIKEKSKSLQEINVASNIESAKGKFKNEGSKSYVYIIAAVSLLLNFIFHFVGILKYDLWLKSGNLSMFGALSKLGEYDNDGMFVMLSVILWTGPLLIILSVALWVYQTFLKGKPRKKGLIFIACSVLYSNFLQAVGVVIALSSGNDGIFNKAVSATGACYFLFIFAIVAIITIIMSYSYLKKAELKPESLAAENEDDYSGGNKV